ncbi:MAG TPA: hypothetical protein VFV87_02435 [Pirellulaceae bacterium]|nr:hypothetical protein [Pirellulaceae bacterium]
MTDAERDRLTALRAAVQAELPDLVARNQLREEARREPTLSGALRRAVRDSHRPLHHLAREIGVEAVQLDEFLTGERRLFSDVMDRLARAVGVELPIAAVPLANPAARQSIDSAAAHTPGT